jgi:hypothetical protein
MRLKSLVPTAAMIVGLGALPLTAQQGATNYAPLEFVVGSCWVGTFGDGKTTDTHCFEWVYDHRFIRDRHVVNSTPKYEGESMYAFDPASRRILFRYLGSQGLIMDGILESRGVDTLVFVGSYNVGSGPPVVAQSEWVVLGPNAYRATNSQKGASGWVAQPSVEYRRKP